LPIKSKKNLELLAHALDQSTSRDSNELRTIGIIGGLGPDTTSRFYMSVIRECFRHGTKANPGILIYSVPIDHEEEAHAIKDARGEDVFLPMLFEAIAKLESNVEFIVMPCNTLHLHIEKLRGVSSVPVLSIVEETIKYLNLNYIQDVALLATGLTVKKKLYQEPLEKNGVKVILPSEAQQMQLNKAVQRLVTGKARAKDRENIREIISSFKGKTKTVLLACTDLQLIAPQHPDLHVIDSMAVLAKATANESIYSDYARKVCEKNKQLLNTRAEQRYMISERVEETR